MAQTMVDAEVRGTIEIRAYGDELALLESQEPARGVATLDEPGDGIPIALSDLPSWGVE